MTNKTPAGRTSLSGPTEADPSARRKWSAFYFQGQHPRGSEPMKPLAKPDPEGWFAREKTCRELLFDRLNYGCESFRFCIYFEQEVKKQLNARSGEVENEWRAKFPDTVFCNRIDQILKAMLWNEGARFHPEDQFAVLINFRYGDLVETDIIRQIEEVVGRQFTVEEIEAVAEAPYWKALQFFKKTREEGNILKGKP
ncbi:MAG: hypothetical protein GY765_33320 [bacterium]|nr:hypothetical protein [bacterium]